MPTAKILSKTETRTDDAPRAPRPSLEEVAPASPVTEADAPESDPYDNVACTD
jgi:hypothetical protein